MPSAGATPRPDGIGLRLLDAPTSASSDPRARLYIVDHLAPGTVIHRRIEVANSTTSASHIRLYPAAARIAKGSFLGAAGHTPNDLSTWTSVSPRAVDISPGGRAIAVVSIAVPRDAAPGERYGVVWAEARSTPNNRGITQVNRVGIRIYLSVGPGGAPAADFSIDSLTPERSPNGRPMVVATVHNTGGRALDMSGSLQLLDGPGGLSAGPFPATLGTTLGIDETESVQIVLDKRLPAGPWDARIVLHSGLLEHTGRATITFPAAGIASPVTVSPVGRGWFYLAIGLIVALLTALGVMLVTIARRRLRPAPTI
ncbi:MAG: hypothetical protein QOF16_378 [Actinomycetota bacterium]|nr:hypothetical protein [Actinomycetota bacterium]